MINKLIVSAGIFFLSSCTAKEVHDIKQSSVDLKSTFTASITTDQVRKERIKKNVSFSGSVVCNPEKSISYIPNYSGSIVRSHIKVGEKVKKGQKLLEVRSSELNSMQSDLISIKEEIIILKRELESAERLFADNFLSERDLLEARSKIHVAENRYEKSLSDISIYGCFNESGLIEILAPTDGYIISKNGSAGSTFTSENEPLFIVSDLNDVWVLVNVYASDLQFVEVGMKADITTISYRNEKFYGIVDNISQVFDSEDRTLKARIVLENQNMMLKPGVKVSDNLNSDYGRDLISVTT